MKTTATRNKASMSKPGQPFFNKSGEGSFFAAGKEESVPFFQAQFIQESLAVGAPNDPFEREADKIGRQVMDNFDQASGIQRKLSGIGVQPMIQAMPVGTRISRMVQRRQAAIQAKCDECEQEGLAQPKSLGIQYAGEGAMVSADIESKINSLKGSGQPMDVQTKTIMESSFGADFSGVRIHTGSGAVQMSQELNAHAFTVGSDIYFNQGRYQPQTKQGAGLLSHELTHTVQQGAVVQSKSIKRKSLSRMLAKHAMAHLSSMDNPALSRKEMAQLEKMPEEEMMQQKEILESQEVDKVQKKDSRLSLRRCNKKANPTLKKTQVSAPVASDCGGFKWPVKWSIDNADSTTNGWVVQKVELISSATDCSKEKNPVDLETNAGALKPSWYPIWEAWQVKGGKVYIGRLNSLHNADTYGQGSIGDNTKGSTTVKGTAEYYDGLTLPSSFVVKNTAPAWALPVTTTQPTLTGGTGSLQHDLTGTWDCCGADKSTKITTV